MAEPSDFYAVLGVPRDAITAAALKDAFRSLALKYHPDRTKEPGAEERFKKIAEAYAVLSDPRKRAQYDAGGRASYSPEDLFAGIDFGSLFGGLGSAGLGLDFGQGFFDRFFGRRAGPPRGEDLQVQLEIPLERVLTGGEESVRAQRPARCKTCHGSGAKPGTRPRSCQSCQGKGQRVLTQRKAGIQVNQVSACSNCGGRGQVIDQLCLECRGRGETLVEETFTVRIPVGAEDGMALRIPGRGMPAPSPHGVPGDLLVVIATRSDPRFERHGADLLRSEQIDVEDAVLGRELEIPTLDGKEKVTVEPGMQPDTMVRLKGKGLVVFGGGRRGDLYVRIFVRIPQQLTLEQRRQWMRLRGLAHLSAAIGESNHPTHA